MKRKIPRLSLAMALCCALLAAALPAGAAEPAPAAKPAALLEEHLGYCRTVTLPKDAAVEDVVFRGTPCGSCEVGQAVYSYTYGPWQDIGTTRCRKYANCLDLVRQRPVYTWLGCTNASCRYNKSPALLNTSTAAGTYCSH